MISPTFKRPTLKKPTTTKGYCSTRPPSTIEFNELGNPLLETDPLGNQTVYVRNPRMNITRKGNLGGSRRTGACSIVYAEEKTYDARDNVLTYTEAVRFPEERTTTYAYDIYDRLDFHHRSRASWIPNKTRSLHSPTTQTTIS